MQVTLCPKWHYCHYSDAFLYRYTYLEYSNYIIMSNYVTLGTNNRIRISRTFICFAALVDRGTFSQNINTAAQQSTQLTSHRFKFLFFLERTKDLNLLLH